MDNYGSDEKETFTINIGNYFGTLELTDFNIDFNGSQLSGDLLNESAPGNIISNDINFITSGITLKIEPIPANVEVASNDFTWLFSILALPISDLSNEFDIISGTVSGGYVYGTEICLKQKETSGIDLLNTPLEISVGYSNSIFKHFQLAFTSNENKLTLSSGDESIDGTYVKSENPLVN